MIDRASDVYSAREIALAAGLDEDRVAAAIGDGRRFVPFAEAVRLGQDLSGRDVESSRKDAPLFSLVLGHDVPRSAAGIPIAVSSTLHVGAIAAVIFATTFGLAPARAAATDAAVNEPMRLVFVATPGPGGGGGGGGLRQRQAPPKAQREGRSAMSSPLPRRDPPKPIEPVPQPEEPKPPVLNAESLPVIVAPVITAPADKRDQIGVLEETKAESASHGPGVGGGAGSGTGTGVGQGDGPGIGPGSGGGIGGGPYRPGSGIQPPRVLREVRADYTEEARRRSVTGEVVLEIVVRHDGTVGDVKVKQRLGSGLDERAIEAVRQWRFAPATRQGTPVDVIVEVAVEFRLK
jgi:TonB family protein